MKHTEDYRNGDVGSGASTASRSDDSEGEEASALEQELSLEEGPEAAARVLLALNALRRARQHYDVVLEAGGRELPAHRAVLAAAAHALLALLPAPAEAPALLRLPDLDPDALATLVDYMYTGTLRVPDVAAARRLYCAAARLRVEPARAHLADRLLRRLSPQDCLQLRALPDLSAAHRAQLDAYIAHNFDEVCAAGALAALPLLRVELLRETSSDGCEETPAALADAALAWLKSRLAIYYDVEELCSRVHLLYVDAGGALRDCGELPAADGDAPELEEYRREARERERAGRRRTAAESSGGGDEWAVVACRAGGGATRAVVALRGRLAAARVAWRATSASDTPRGGKLGGPADYSPPIPEEGGARLASMSVGRCAVGCAVVGGRLVVCGGYDRARALRAVEAFRPQTNAWRPLPDMRRARARLCAARLRGRLYVLGGSDGYTELDSVDVYEEGGESGEGGGKWASAAPLPVARQYAAAAADETSGTLLVVGGAAGGRSLRRVHRYCAERGEWSEAPPLAQGRSQGAAAVWGRAAWVLGGCDEWRCLASTERLPLDDAGAAWAAGPPLPTARRSVGAAVWRGALVAAGGSAGSASLRQVDLLGGAGGAAAWRSGPPLRRPRAAPALAELGGVLYAAGGYSGKEFLACVERLTDPGGAWTQLVHDVLPAVLPAEYPSADETKQKKVETEDGAAASPQTTTC
ncbi:influenza virus NS1A-binding protein homolog [Leptidea sinapis]|uniref:influenza virus NS1A-binding protein homolog n=1 Tax=Leptidea sinapis TaxID=189913 RepID=UPI0021C4AE5D|nr:influenza virus NS1A-binding protein homolog [Leptidea sinapis]